MLPKANIQRRNSRHITKAIIASLGHRKDMVSRQDNKDILDIRKVELIFHLL